MDLSVDKQQVDKAESKPLESTTIHCLTSVPSSPSKSFTSTFLSSLASSAAKVSADVTDLTGRYGLREIQGSVRKTNPDSKFRKRSSAR